MEGSKGYQEPDSSLTVCDVCCVVHQKSVPLVGSPTLPFIGQGGSRGYRWEKEENTKGIGGPSKDPGLPFFPRLPCLTWQTVSEVACLLIFVGHVLAQFSKWVCPIPCRQMVRRAGEPSGDHSGSNREVAIRPLL